MAYLHLAHTLADAFNALADEVQTLTDRKTVLEHKLRFAHEQVRKPTLHISLVALDTVTQPGFPLCSLPWPRKLQTSFRRYRSGAVERLPLPSQYDDYLSSRSRASG